MEIPGKGILIVEYFAKWCGPCKLMHPITQKIDEDNDDVTLIKVDVDKQEDLTANNDVKQVPTIHFYKDGVREFVNVGTMSEGAIEIQLKKLRI